MTVALDRGNDYAAADQEARARFGEYPNAEDVLAAAMASRDRETLAAGLKRPNEEATESLELSKIKVPRNHTVLSATVRGNRVVFVADDGTGRCYKGSTPFKG